MANYIDKDKLMKHYAWWGDDNENKKIFDEIIGLQEVVHDVEKVVRGRWEPTSKNFSQCSNCGTARDIRTQYGWNFCPVCGCKMGE